MAAISMSSTFPMIMSPDGPTNLVRLSLDLMATKASRLSTTIGWARSQP